MRGEPSREPKEECQDFRLPATPASALTHKAAVGPASVVYAFEHPYGSAHRGVTSNDHVAPN